MTNEERRAALEAIIYAADEPATVEQLAAALDEENSSCKPRSTNSSPATPPKSAASKCARSPAATRCTPSRSITTSCAASSRAYAHRLRLTMPALETASGNRLQATGHRPEIGEIRSVNTSGVLKRCSTKRLITTAGRKEVIGRPILYKTSKEFLMRFA